MKWIFVLGRNPELSAAEINAYLETNGVKVLGKELKSNALLVDTEGEIDAKKAVSELGGTVAIGKEMVSGNQDEVLKYIEKTMIYRRKENKIQYSIFNYSSEEIFDEVYSAVQRNLRNDGLKATYRSVRGTIKLQNKEVVSGSPERIKEDSTNYFLFGEESLAFGLILAVSDSKELEERDMNRPERRESLSISPRLAKILINLSGAKKGKTLIDPFCGVGVILQECVIRGIDCFGLDVDKKAIANAKKNIEWLRSKMKISSRVEVACGDSQKFSFGGFDCIATEPDLGVVLRDSPRPNEAMQMIQAYEKLMIHVLTNLKRFAKGKARFAFTAPLILVSGKRIGCNIEVICNIAGLRMLENPIQEYRQGQVVGREIYVLTS